jgi:predicted transcriptional regulator
MAVCALADALNLNPTNRQAQTIRASYDVLAEKMGASRSTARRAIADLIAKGWLEIVRIGSGHGAAGYRFTRRAYGPNDAGIIDDMRTV